MDAIVKFRADIEAVNDEERIVYGWASVVEVGGEPVIDHQDDVIDLQEITKAAHEFLDGERTGGVMHVMQDGKPVRVGKVVESIVFRPELQEALGVSLGKSGWFIGYQVEHDGIWKKVKSGDLRAFSIGGKGRRTPVEE